MADATIRVAITSDNRDLTQGLQDSQSKLASFGKAAAKATLIAAGAIAVGAVALGKASVEAASLAQQSLGGTQAVFGKFADQVIKDSKRAALGVGLSANQYRESANIIGSLLVNQGVQQDRLRGQTKDLIGTAADLAATFGGPTKDAVDALASAYKGEFDPLQNYGITVKQSTINTEALRVAHVKSTAAFNKLSAAQQTSAKRQATTNLITKQATVAQGQFSKQSSTLAEQQQILGAQWDNLKVKIGNALIPAVSALFRVLSKQVMPVLGKLAKQYLPPITKQIKQWAQGDDPSKMMTRIGDSLKGVDWKAVGSDIGGLGDDLKTLGPALKDLSVDTVNDSFRVFGTVVGFAADHVDTLRKFMPLLVTGFVAFKGAQVANQLVGRDSLIGLGAQLYTTRQLTNANRELATSLELVTGAERTANSPMNTLGATAGTTGGRFGKLGLAAKGAAGIGGIALLTSSAGSSNKALGALGDIAGGAALGAAFGPEGALVGGIIGAGKALIDFTGDAHDASGEMAATGPVAADYASSFDSITGSITGATRAAILNQAQTSGAAAEARNFGISSRVLVNAVLGNKDAIGQVNAALDKGKTFTVAWSDANGIAQISSVRNQRQLEAFKATIEAEGGSIDSVRKKTLDLAGAKSIHRFIGQQTNEWRAASKAKRQDILATEDLRSLYGKLPKKVVTKLDSTGIVPTTKGIARVARRFHLLPKQVKAVISALGVDTTVKKVDKVKKHLADAGKAKANLQPFKQSVDTQLARFRQDATTGGKTISDNLKRETGKAKPDLTPFQRGLKQSLSGAKSTASSGGGEVGSSLKSGVLNGVSGLGTDLSSQVSGAVTAAIAAGRAAAGAKSPSKKMYALGQDMSTGLVLGLTSMNSALVKAGTGTVDAAMFSANSRMQQLTSGEPLAVRLAGGTAVAQQPVQLRPRETPIKIFLDGAEIADHLTLKGNRLMATSNAIRRRP